MLLEHFFTIFIFFALWAVIFARIMNRGQAVLHTKVNLKSRELCPNCGKPLAGATPVKQHLNGAAYYFCSFECRGQFVREKWVSRHGIN